MGLTPFNFDSGLWRRAAAFAVLAKTVLQEAQAHVRSGSKQPSLQGLYAESGRSHRMLTSVAERAEACGDVEVEELAYAVLWAVRSNWISHWDLRFQMRDLDEALEVWSYCSIIARAVLHSRKERAASNLPPVEYVAFHIASHCGAYVHPQECPELGDHLASAFPEGQLSVEEGEEIVVPYYGELITPGLANQIAAVAVEQAKRALAEEGSGGPSSSRVQPVEGGLPSCPDEHSSSCVQELPVETLAELTSCEFCSACLRGAS